MSFRKYGSWSRVSLLVVYGQSTDYAKDLKNKQCISYMYTVSRLVGFGQSTGCDIFISMLLF